MMAQSCGEAGVRQRRRVLIVTALACAPMLAAACHASETQTKERRIIEVRADRGWQESGVIVDGRTPFTLRHVPGQTHDRNTTIANGAGSDDVCARADCCEPMPNVRRGVLIGRIGTDVFDVSNGGRFTRRAKGPLFLRLNECDARLRDNVGTLTVEFVPDIGLATGY